MDTYNIRIIELSAEDLQRAGTNGGLNIPLSPETRLVNIKGALQTKESPKVTKVEDSYPPLGGLPVAG